MVTWSTMNSTRSYVEYGVAPSQLNKLVHGKSELFTDGGTEHRQQYIHRVILSGLEPNTTYCKTRGD